VYQSLVLELLTILTVKDRYYAKLLCSTKDNFRVLSGEEGERGDDEGGRGSWVKKEKWSGGRGKGEVKVGDESANIGAAMGLMVCVKVTGMDRVYHQPYVG
jgi:hypothetical protein